LRAVAGTTDNAAGMKELRVPTVALAAEVACSDGRTFMGRIFVPAAASHHSGPMRPEEWINEPLFYFPFLPDDAAVPVMLNKHTAVVVTLPGGDLSEADEPVGRRQRVAIECAGRRLEGMLHIDMPENQQRVQDHLNRPELFLILREGPRRHLVQKRHITRVIEIREE
jgi:hypothetical protein